MEILQHTNDDICAICIESLSDTPDDTNISSSNSNSIQTRRDALHGALDTTKKIIYLPGCKHTFHVKCFFDYMHYNDINVDVTCPICRRTIIKAIPLCIQQQQQQQQQQISASYDVESVINITTASGVIALHAKRFICLLLTMFVGFVLLYFMMLLVSDIVNALLNTK